MSKPHLFAFGSVLLGVLLGGGGGVASYRFWSEAETARATLETAQSDLEQSHQQVGELEKQLASAKEDKGQVESELGASQKDLQAERQSTSTLAQELAKMQTRNRELSAELIIVNNRLAAVQERMRQEGWPDPSEPPAETESTDAQIADSATPPAESPEADAADEPSTPEQEPDNLVAVDQIPTLQEPPPSGYDDSGWYSVARPVVGKPIITPPQSPATIIHPTVSPQVYYYP